ncbi:hypothetical protein KY362_00795 [Candidatus Woesearchaeota archaeon]|nr:hypothetical protein [Candidatus Woesearchaeota archaeon]
MLGGRDMYSDKETRIQGLEYQLSMAAVAVQHISEQSRADALSFLESLDFFCSELGVEVTPSEIDDRLYEAKMIHDIPGSEFVIADFPEDMIAHYADWLLGLREDMSADAQIGALCGGYAAVALSYRRKLDILKDHIESIYAELAELARYVLIGADAELSDWATVYVRHKTDECVQVDCNFEKGAHMIAERFDPSVFSAGFPEGAVVVECPTDKVSVDVMVPHICATLQIEYLERKYGSFIGGNN